MLAATLLALAALTSATAAPVAPVERASPLRPAFIYIHPKSQPTKCLSALRGGRGGYANTALTVRDCVGSQDQQFRVDADVSTIWLASTDTDELCVDTSGGESSGRRTALTPEAKPGAKPDLKDGRDAMLRPCPRFAEYAAPTNGWWDFRDGVHFRINGTNTCLDVRDGKTEVQQWTCFKGNTNQEWTVNEKGGPFKPKPTPTPKPVC